VRKRIVSGMQSLYAHMDRTLTLIRSFMSAPCKAGCDHCCYQYVSVSALEVFGLVDVIRKDAALKRYFESKIVVLQEQVEILREPDMTNYKWFDRRVPCVFLEDHKCMVYADRPLVCRTHLVIEDSADGCRHQKDLPKIKILDKSLFVKAMVDKSMRLGEEAGISWGWRPLQLALLDAWDILENGKEPVKLSRDEEIKAMLVWSQIEQ